MGEHGIGRGDRVAVWARKSVDAVVALYSIMKCGAAYVPIDPTAPPARVGRIMVDCEVAGLVAESSDLALARQFLAPTAVTYRLGEDVAADPTGAADAEGGGRIIGWRQALREYDGAAAGGPGPDPDHLAYILYTSGSTGVPKGVMLTHRNARSFTDWSADEFALTPEDRVSSHAPFHFDLSVLDLFATCRAGACMVLVRESQVGLGYALNQLIATRNITVWYSVPNALVRMLSARNSDVLSGSALRVVLFAGEVFPVKYLRRLRTLVPSAALYNLYGPTETNVCTFHRVRDQDVAPDRVDAAPIGRPCPYARTYLVDPDGQAVDQRPGAVGELLVAGDSVMAGYWRDRHLTERRMARLTREGGPVLSYRTGDLVGLDDEMNLVYRGRQDSMVKVRGYRVELGEIEAVLLGLGGVGEAACVAVGGPDTDRHIEAYVAAADDSCDADRLRRDCLNALPRYMVPERVHIVGSLPRTPTGKIDRSALLHAQPLP
jgi:amino acid adenylation domain-containing protein